LNTFPVHTGGQAIASPEHIRTATTKTDRTNTFFIFKFLLSLMLCYGEKSSLSPPFLKVLA
jgi:hypothetical protein